MNAVVAPPSESGSDPQKARCPFHALFGAQAKPHDHDSLEATSVTQGLRQIYSTAPVKEVLARFSRGDFSQLEARIAPPGSVLSDQDYMSAALPLQRPIAVTKAERAALFAQVIEHELVPRFLALSRLAPETGLIRIESETPCAIAAKELRQTPPAQFPERVIGAQISMFRAALQCWQDEPYNCVHQTLAFRALRFLELSADFPDADAFSHDLSPASRQLLRGTASGLYVAWGLLGAVPQQLRAHSEPLRAPAMVALAKSSYQEMVANFARPHRDISFPFLEHIRNPGAWTLNPEMLLLKDNPRQVQPNQAAVRGWDDALPLAPPEGDDQVGCAALFTRALPTLWKINLELAARYYYSQIEQEPQIG
jgi:hypothetical protein